MRLRALGIDYFALEAERWRAAQRALLLPVPNVAACVPQLDGSTVATTLISSCDTLSESRIKQPGHTAGHEEVTESTAGKDLSEKFERVLVESCMTRLQGAFSTVSLDEEGRPSIGEASEDDDGSEGNQLVSCWYAIGAMGDADVQSSSTERLGILEDKAFLDGPPLLVRHPRTRTLAKFEKPVRTFKSNPSSSSQVNLCRDNATSDKL